MSFESNKSLRDKFRMNMSQHYLKYSHLKNDILENNLAQNNNINSNIKSNYPNNNNQIKENTKIQKGIINEIELNVILKRSELKSSIKLMKISINQYIDKQSKIIIQITNPLDPLFLYILELSEIEYQEIKSKQSLLIDFQKFPQFILKMLSLCKNGRAEEKYFCILSISETGGNNLKIATPGILIIEEKTEFRKLNHLMSKSHPAKNIILKKNLSNISKEYKEKYGSLLQKYNELYQNYNICQKKINELEDNFKNLGLKMDNLKNEKNKKINDLKKQISLLQNTIEDLNKKNLKLELDKKDFESKYSKINTELNMCKSEISNLRNENSKLNQKCVNDEKKLAEYNFKIKSLYKLSEESNNLENLKQLKETFKNNRYLNKDNIILNSKEQEINQQQVLLDEQKNTIKEIKKKKSAKEQEISGLENKYMIIKII